MMDILKKIDIRKLKVLFAVLLIAIAFLGIGMRFFEITHNQFFYYDEGLFLNNNLSFLRFVSSHPPQNINRVLSYLTILTHLSLAGGKALWSFICGLRAFILSYDAWYFVRIVSAIFGSFTILLTYLFAFKYYRSHWIALLSFAILAVLPSHLYYSRLAMQEAVSCFCFLAGMYFYIFPRRLNFRTFLSGILFACVFFTNYRMIIIPVLTGICEGLLSFAEGRRFDFRKYMWNTLTFLFVVFMVGDIDDAANTRVTFAWMFYQAHLAEGHFDIINFLSYPYYLFKLESVFFGLLFFGNFYYIIKKEWRMGLPFIFVCIQMIIFSMPQEKGVRYLCFAFPFMAMAVASLIVYLFQNKHDHVFRRFVILLAVSMFFVHIIKDNNIIHFHSDYGTAVNDIERVNKNAGIIASQELVLRLFASNPRKVVKPPVQVKYFLYLYKKGFRYFVLGPQAYISYTEDGKRFSMKLGNYIGFIDRNILPVRVYPHFNKAMLERFVLEHNENLLRSIKFILANNKNGTLGKLKVYDMNQCIAAMYKIMKAQNKLSGL